MIRLFLGIEFDKHIKEPLLKIKDQADFAKASWVNAQNIHLTIKFLGWTKEETIGQIKNAVRAVTDCFYPFEISINELGAFPTAKKARIFWVGIKEDTGTLEKLQNGIENSMRPLGFKKEKRTYHPHVTLARLRVLEDVSNDLDIVIASRKMEVRELTLFQSKLTQKGAVYSIIEKFPLRT